MLNPGVGCPRGTAYDLSAGDLADNPLAPPTVCQEDLTQNYGVITPAIERFGLSGRVTATLGDSREPYGAFNFLQTDVSANCLPPTLPAHAPPPVPFPPSTTP